MSDRNKFFRVEDVKLLVDGKPIVGLADGEIALEYEHRGAGRARDMRYIASGELELRFGSAPAEYLQRGQAARVHYALMQWAIGARMAAEDDHRRRVYLARKDRARARRRELERLQAWLEDRSFRRRAPALLARAAILGAGRR